MSTNPSAGGGANVTSLAAQPNAANVNEEDALYPIAVLIDELRNEDVQVN